MSTLPPHRVLILVNSASCRNSGNRCYTDSVIPLLRNASIETIVHEAEGAENVSSLVNNHNLLAVDSILLVGGDGTFSYCANSLLQRSLTIWGQDLDELEQLQISPPPVTIGILPNGTCEGMSTHCYGHTDMSKATSQIIEGKRRKLPVLAVYNGAEFLRFACLALGIGFSSLTVTTLEQKKKEKLPFPNTFLKLFRLSTLNRSGLKLHIHEYTSQLATESVCQTVGPVDWFDFMVFPWDMLTFDPDKPVMTVIVIKRKVLMWFKLMFYLTKFNAGLLREFLRDASHYCDIFNCSRLKIEIEKFASLKPRHQFINVDGDLFQLHSNIVEIRYHADALWVHGHHPNYTKRLLGLQQQVSHNNNPRDNKCVGSAGASDEAARSSTAHREGAMQNDGRNIQGSASNRPVESHEPSDMPHAGSGIDIPVADLERLSQREHADRLDSATNELVEPLDLLELNCERSHIFQDDL